MNVWRELPCNEDALADAGLTAASMQKLLAQAKQFHQAFAAMSQCDERGLSLHVLPAWREKWVRRHGNTPDAVYAKLGSNRFSKRRATDPTRFLEYLNRQYQEELPLLFRLGAGPVKNVRQYGASQAPDLAEYLMLVQLARVMEAVAAIYPYGVRVQMIPDDIRGRHANSWREEYGRRYIAGLQCMVRELGFAAWLEVENGQSRVYDRYNVDAYRDVAEKQVLCSPDFQKKFETACLKAQQNLVLSQESKAGKQAVRESAIRYLIANQAEALSGMWTPQDAFPLRYAHHDHHFQLFTMGSGLTKLPWQIQLPLTGLEARGYII